MKGYFVTGTDTGVGKTEIAAYIARRLANKGLKVGVMKPIATGVGRSCEDVEILRKSVGSKDPEDCINPISLKLPFAPMVASRIEKAKIDMKRVWESFKKLKRENDVVIAEGVGGVMVPIYKRANRIYYVLDMIKEMKFPVIVVSRPNLGTINHTAMTIETLRRRKIKIKGIILNYTSLIKKDLSVKTNPRAIERLTGIRVLGIMHYNKNRNKRRIKWLRKTEF